MLPTNIHYTTSMFSTNSDLFIDLYILTIGLKTTATVVPSVSATDRSSSGDFYITIVAQHLSYI